MNHIEKKHQLESIIKRELLPLIDNDYVLYGLPYYNNIGDSLIWDGELELLKLVPHRCVGVCGWNSYPNKKLPENIIILITGGGYFGDVWRNGWQYVLDGIQLNKNNRIIILPNTIYYEDESVCRRDAEFLAGFPQLIICARDKVSYDRACNCFSNQVMLVPDMAFCMQKQFLRKWQDKQPVRGALLFKRNDKECPDTDFKIPEQEYDVHDWLPMEQYLPTERNFDRIVRRLHYLRHVNDKLPELALHMLYEKYYRRLMTNLGARQLSAYSKIYTTRLHAMILGMMLGRDITVIDNSYGKLSSYYETWLTDCDNVKVLG